MPWQKWKQKMQWIHWDHLWLGKCYFSVFHINLHGTFPYVTAFLISTSIYTNSMAVGTKVRASLKALKNHPSSQTYLLYFQLCSLQRETAAIAAVLRQDVIFSCGITFRRLYFRFEYTWGEGEGGQFWRTISLVWWDSRFISNTNTLLSEPKITDTNLSTEPVGNSNLYKLESAKPATF